MRAALYAVSVALATVLPGCVIVQTGVTNPIPGMTTVAVAPFVNLSAERVVDGRRFALAYHAELQKVPGYQVIPVGVTEQAMVDLGIDLDSPDDALKLAKALGADAVVIGAVTDYTPYYPPRIGLQVSWYSPEPHRFSPGIPTDPHLNDAVKIWRFAAFDRAGATVAGEAPIIRAQSADEASVSANCLACEATNSVTRGPVLLAPNAPVAPPVPPDVQRVAAEDSPFSEAVATPPVAESELPPLPPAANPANAANAANAESAESAADASPAESPPASMSAPGTVPVYSLFPPESCPPLTAVQMAPGYCPPLNGAYAVGVASGTAAAAFDPREPVMSYTRLFDGSDAELTALLRDYVILSGDLRSGGWEAYLHRTEDFIRFTSHRMIVEMLTLHGGESRRRYVWMYHRGHH